MIINATFKFDANTVGNEQTIVSAANTSGYAFVVDINNKLRLAIWNEEKRQYSVFNTNERLYPGRIYNVTAVYKEQQILLYIYDSSNELRKEVSQQFDGLRLNQNSQISTLIGANPTTTINRYDAGCFLTGNVYNVKMWYNQEFNDNHIMMISKEAIDSIF